MLNLNELDTDDIPGITREKGNDLAQAGAVCLHLHRHQQGVRFVVQGFVSKTYALAWPPVTEQALRTWNDPDEAAEDGAAGIAALLAIREIGYPVVLRSRKTTGFDYWLGDKDTSNISQPEQAATKALREVIQDNDMVVRGRMEVSGIRRGDNAVVRARVRRKLSQTNRSDALGLPAYVIVVEFGRPLAEVRAK
jgi:hypothetical protein